MKGKYFHLRVAAAVHRTAAVIHKDENWGDQQTAAAEKKPFSKQQCFRLTTAPELGLFVISMRIFFLSRHCIAIFNPFPLLLRMIDRIHPQILCSVLFRRCLLVMTIKISYVADEFLFIL